MANIQRLRSFLSHLGAANFEHRKFDRWEVSRLTQGGRPDRGGPLGELPRVFPLDIAFATVGGGLYERKIRFRDRHAQGELSPYDIGREWFELDEKQADYLFMPEIPIRPGNGVSAESWPEYAAHLAGFIKSLEIKQGIA